MDSASRYIPAEIKREVRQRCGFGCVICGMPLFEYEHMLEFATVQRHVADEITLLCPNHHAQKTRGRLPAEQIKLANDRPFNLDREMTPPETLYFSGDFCEVLFGSNTVSADLPGDSYLIALMIDNEVILGFRAEDRRLLLTMRHYDSKDDLLLEVVDSELVFRTKQWDVDWVGDILTIREGQRSPTLTVRFRPPSTVEIPTARLRRNKVEVRIDPEILVVTNNGSSLRDCHFSNNNAVLSIGGTEEETVPGLLTLVDMPRTVPQSLKDANFLKAKRA